MSARCDLDNAGEHCGHVDEGKPCCACGYVRKENLRQRIAALESQIKMLEAMRTHCENCGGDYMATGIEAGCPCLLKAQVKTLQDALLDRIATENGNDVPTLGDIEEMAEYLKKYHTAPKPNA